MISSDYFYDYTYDDDHDKNPIMTIIPIYYHHDRFMTMMTELELEAWTMSSASLLATSKVSWRSARDVFSWKNVMDVVMDEVVFVMAILSFPGWWLGHPSEKYEFVDWDDDSNPIFLGKCKKRQPNHQPVLIMVNHGSSCPKIMVNHGWSIMNQFRADAVQ